MQERSAQVAFLPGAGFGATMQNYLRVSISYYDAAGMRVGAERLGDHSSPNQRRIAAEMEAHKGEARPRQL